MTGEVRSTRAEDCVRVVISNPDKLNAISGSMWREFEGVLESLNTDEKLRCVVLQGDGESAFSSGADIAEFDALRSNSEQAVAFARPVHRCFHLLRSLPVPTLAAIRGVCAGGGLELASCCDLRLCTPDSRFGIPINKIGAALSYVELEVLIAAVGRATALELLLEGRMLSAEEAYAKGMITRIVPRANFEIEVITTMRRVATAAPLPVRWHKAAIQRLADPEPLTEVELREGYSCLDTEDYKGGYRAFLEGKRYEFQGR